MQSKTKVEVTCVEEKASCVEYIRMRPFGEFAFYADTEKEMEEGLKRIFDAKPKEYDYIKAAWVVHCREEKKGATWHVSKIDEEEFWNDEILLQKNKWFEEIEERPKTMMDLYGLTENKKDFYLRIDDCVNDQNMRDVSIIKPQKIILINGNKMILLANEAETYEINEALGIEQDENDRMVIQTIELDAEKTIEDSGFTYFTEEEMEWIKKEIAEYVESVDRDNLSFDEFLEKKQKKGV